MGAFEQLFGPVREEFSKNFPKIQITGELPGGDVEALNLTGTLSHMLLTFRTEKGQTELFLALPIFLTFKDLQYI